MRTLRAVGLVGLSFVAGAASWAAWTGYQYQGQPASGARFAIGGQEDIAMGTTDYPFSMHYLRDTRTGGCYLAAVAGSKITALTPAQDRACSGL